MADEVPSGVSELSAAFEFPYRLDDLPAVEPPGLPRAEVERFGGSLRIPGADEVPPHGPVGFRLLLLRRDPVRVGPFLRSFPNGGHVFFVAWMELLLLSSKT